MRLPAIRTVLAAYRSEDAHITEEQITAAWVEYDALCAPLDEADQGRADARETFDDEAITAAAVEEWDSDPPLDRGSRVHWDALTPDQVMRYRARARRTLNAALASQARRPS